MAAWHYGTGGVRWSGAGNGLDGGRQGDTGGAEGEARGGSGCGAKAEMGAVLLDFGLGQRVEVGEDGRPGSGLAEPGDAVVERALQQQGEERAEDVAADGLVELVVNGAGGEQMLGGAEGRFDDPELLVAQHRLKRIETGIGLQHKDTIEAGIRLGLGQVDGKMARAGGLEKAAIAGIADQRFVAAAELAGKAGEDGLALSRILLGLLLVAADDVALPAEGDRLGA